MKPIATTTANDDEIMIDAEAITHVIRDPGRGGAIVFFSGGVSVLVTMPFVDFLKAWQSATS